MDAFTIVFIVWILPVILSTVIGAKKGKGGTGFILGLFFSWIGFFISLILSPSVEAVYSKQNALNNTVKADERRCPDCAEIIKKEAKVCRHCGKKFELA